MNIRQIKIDIKEYIKRIKREYDTEKLLPLPIIGTIIAFIISTKLITLLTFIMLFAVSLWWNHNKKTSRPEREKPDVESEKFITFGRR